MKKIMSVLLVFTLLLTSAFALASCGDQDQPTGDLAEVKAAGKLVVGITDYAPMDYKDANGKWIGFDAELAEMFASSLGVKCEFVEIDWDSKVSEINTKQIDLIWNGMTASDELGQKIDFSVSYAKNAQVAVVKKGSTITKDTVASASVAVEGGSAGETTANEVIKPSKVNVAENQVSALLEVLAGTSDVAVVDITMAQSLVGKGQYADLQIVEGATYGDELFAVGLRQGRDIKATLDAFLKAKYADGTITALATKYEVGINEDALK